jgi:hypothetical protein
VSGLELGHPVIGLVGLAALDIAGPGDDVHFALAAMQPPLVHYCRMSRSVKRFRNIKTKIVSIGYADGLMS